MTKIMFWAGLAAATLMVMWLLLASTTTPDANPTPAEQTTLIEVLATNPWLIGTTDDAFSYAGEHATVVIGEAKLRMESTAHAGVLEIILQPSEVLLARLELSSNLVQNSVTLQMQPQEAVEIWSDILVNKGQAVGETRLPTTHASYASRGKVRLIIDEQEHPTTWVGFWFIGDALRQDDGSIRNQGLVFSPLLRDPSIFSDPTRRELTLLVYETSDMEAVVLHLVFPNTQLSGIMSP